MRKLVKLSWQQKLQDRNKVLEDENWKLRMQMMELVARLELANSYAKTPPTFMIACEKVVESAAQLTCSANTLIQKVLMEKGR